MPYIQKTIKQAKKEFKKSDKVYKLCYIDTIPQTIYGYRPEIEEKYSFIKGLTFEQFQEVAWKYPEYRMEELPNSEYIPGEREMMAYFTPLPLHEQRGDDWNDVPYDCNAGCPYDDIVLEVTEKDGIRFATKIENYDVITIPFCVRSNNYILPKDYGYNSPFSVDMINDGAVAWIYDTADGKRENVTTIHAGCSIRDFISAIERIAKNNPEYKPYTDEDE